MIDTFTFDDILIKPVSFSAVKSRGHTDLSQTLQGRKFDIPILSASMSSLDTQETSSRTNKPYTEFAEALHFEGGTHIFSRAIPFVERLQAAKDINGGIAVGHQEFEDHKDILQESGVMVSIDIANGAILPNNINWEGQEQPLIIGNFGNPEVISYRKFSANTMVKFGIGPSAVCSTREMTGVGAPQGWLISEADSIRTDEWRRGKRVASNITIVSDGGTKTPGDFVKALGLGADLVMIGTMFAAARETPGEPIKIDGEWYKPVRGMASAAEKGSQKHIEGISGYVPYEGKSVSNIVQELTDGLRSAMAYTDRKDIHQFIGNVDFYRVTPSTVVENRTRLF